MVGGLGLYADEAYLFRRQSVPLTEAVNIFLTKGVGMDQNNAETQEILIPNLALHVPEHRQISVEPLPVPSVQKKSSQHRKYTGKTGSKRIRGISAPLRLPQQSAGCRCVKKIPPENIRNRYKFWALKLTKFTLTS